MLAVALSDDRQRDRRGPDRRRARSIAGAAWEPSRSATWRFRFGRSPGFESSQLEEVASGWGIAREARDEALGLSIESGTADSGSYSSARTMIPRQSRQSSSRKRRLKGKTVAEAILDRARQGVAFALRQAIALLAPGRIILGGGVSLIGEAHWFEPIRGLVDAEVFAPFRGSYDIVPAALGEEVVVHGALALAHDAVGSSS